MILNELTSKTSSSSDVQLIESVVRFRSRVKYRSPVGVILSHSFRFKHFSFCAYDNVNNPSSVIRWNYFYQKNKKIRVKFKVDDWKGWKWTVLKVDYRAKVDNPINTWPWVLSLTLWSFRQNWTVMGRSGRSFDLKWTVPRVKTERFEEIEGSKWTV